MSKLIAGIEYNNVKETAAILGLTITTIKTYFQRQTIKAIKIGHTWYTRDEWIDNYLLKLNENIMKRSERIHTLYSGSGKDSKAHIDTIKEVNTSCKLIKIALERLEEHGEVLYTNSEKIIFNLRAAAENITTVKELIENNVIKSSD